MLKNIAIKIMNFTLKCIHILKNKLYIRMTTQKFFIKNLKMLKKIATKISIFIRKCNHILKNKLYKDYNYKN